MTHNNIVKCGPIIEYYPSCHVQCREDELKANAKLISKAPEMLEALKQFCKRVEEGSIRSRVTYGVFKTIIKEIEE